MEHLKQDFADLEKLNNERTAIMVEAFLGNEHFARQLLDVDASLVEKLLNRIAEAKEALAIKKDPEAQKAFVEVRKAEQMFLDALAEKGMRFEEGKIIGANEEERQKGVQYSIKRPQFTQDDIKKNMEVIASMDAVVTIGVEKLERTGKRPKDIYLDFFDGLGNQITSPIYGDIALSNSSAKSEIRHGNTAEKIAAIEAIPTVIEKGEVIFHRSKPDSDVERIVICAPIKIGTEDYYMGVMLQRDTQSQRLYLHSVVSLATKEEATTSSQADRVTNGALEDDDHLFMTSILQKAVDVKRILEKSSVKKSRKANSQTSGKTSTAPSEASHLTAMQKQTVANYARTKVYTKAEALKVVEDMARFLDENYGFDGGMGEASGFVTLTKTVKEGAARKLWAAYNSAKTDAGPLVYIFPPKAKGTANAVPWGGDRSASTAGSLNSAEQARQQVALRSRRSLQMRYFIYILQLAQCLLSPYPHTAKKDGRCRPFCWWR